MELYQLRTFVTVAQEGHLTRAAERLHLSQPAVSGQIKALEAQFETRLFDRSASGMTLTVAGKGLLEHARKVTHAADELRQAARQLNSDVVGRLRVGTVSDPESIRLGDLLAFAIRRHPRLDLELHHEVSGAALEALRQGQLDASFFFGDRPAAQMFSIPLREFVYRVAAPAAWRERVQDASWSDIAALPWILTPAISTHHQLVSRLFGDQALNPPLRHIEADNESVIVSLVVSGVGASLVLEDAALARQAKGEVCVWQKGAVSTTLWFACAADRVDDPLIKALINLVREAWNPMCADGSAVAKLVGAEAAISS